MQPSSSRSVRKQQRWQAMDILKTNVFILFLLNTLLQVSSYTILGGLPPSGDDTDNNDPQNNSNSNSNSNNNSIITETLRNFQNRQIQLQTQSHESSGRVSMAGTLWEASPVLADYITNQACPLEAFQRMRVQTDTYGNLILPPHPPTSVVELGSGIGLASIAAAFLGCQVCATDGSPSSVRLLNENFMRYSSEFGVLPQASLLEWGDGEAVESLVYNDLGGRLPDVVMASDVVYAHSAREELSQTIRQLCPQGHVHGTVLLAHRWRVDPSGEESFFKSFEDEFEVDEVPMHLMPPDPYYRTRNMMDMKLPVSIFEMRRKW